MGRRRGETPHPGRLYLGVCSCPMADARPHRLRPPAAVLVGRLAGPLVAAAMLAVAPPDGLGDAGWRTAAVGAWMAIWWMTEAVPLAATALVPLAVFPILGIRTMGQTATAYANPVLYLFLGGFLLALAVERWGLHRRLALAVLSRVGASPRRLVAAMLAVTAFLSMWISNTATALMMLPIALAVARLAGSADDATDDAALDPTPAAPQGAFATAMLLAVAYAASLGGMGTPIGTPPNAFFAAYASETLGLRVTFAGWMGVAVPVVLLGLIAAYVMLTRVGLRVPAAPLPGVAALVATERASLGPMTAPERRVAVLFTAVAVGWVSMPLLGPRLPGLTEAGLAIAGALALFLVPAGDGTDARLLSAADVERLPWGVLLLFGGGLSLAAALEATGLAEWMGAAFAGVGGWPFVAVLFVLGVAIAGLGELASNTAMAAALLPVLAPLAPAFGVSPLALLVPATLAASVGFVLPAGTPPNAIVYGTGLVPMGAMVRVGLWLDLVLVALVALVGAALVGPVMGG